MSVQSNQTNPSKGRSLYAVIALDHHPHSGVGEPELELLAGDHVAFVKENDRMIRAAMGIMSEGDEHCGTLYLFEAEDIKQVREWIADEPLCKGGLYKEIKIVPVKVAFSNLAAMPWAVYGLASKEWLRI